MTALVSAPAQVFPAEDIGLRSQCPDQFPPCIVIVGLASLGLRMGTVQPDFRNRAVFGKQFEELVQIILVVIIDIELEFRLVAERTSFHFSRNGPESRLAQIAIESVRAFYLIKVCR